MNTRCPVCHSTTIDQNIQLYGRCGDCSSLYLRRMPPSSYLRDEIRKFEQTVNRGIGDDKINMIYSRRLLDLARFIRPKSKILDVGSGNGIFLNIAHRAGYAVEAMDKAVWCVRNARRMGITAYTDLKKVPGRSYDAITLFDVIEHIPKPRIFIRTIIKKLKSRGILMITTPNNQGITSRLIPSYLTAGDGKYSGHVVLYALRSLIQLLHQEFILLESTTDILLQWSHSKYSVRNKIINKIVYLVLMPFLPFLFSRMRGDNIQVIAKKV